MPLSPHPPILATLVFSLFTLSPLALSKSFKIRSYLFHFSTIFLFYYVLLCPHYNQMITWDTSRKGGLKLILTLSKLSVEFTWQVGRHLYCLVALLCLSLMPCKMDGEASRITKLTALLCILYIIPGPSW